MFLDDNGYVVGMVAFLVKISPEQGGERYELRERPAHTNQSGEPRLSGWCGSTNNVSVFACGVARVVEVRRTGRAKIARLTKGSEEEDLALEELGWPELSRSPVTP